MNYSAKRLEKGKYLYRGYIIQCIGYYSPEHRICWECIDEYGCGFGQGYSLNECKMWIDEELKNETIRT